MRNAGMTRELIAQGSVGGVKDVSKAPVLAREQRDGGLDGVAGHGGVSEGQVVPWVAKGESNVKELPA